MKAELILIANAGMARLFSRASDSDPLLPMETLEHPASRLKVSELGDDRAGHENTDRHAGGVTFAPRVDAKRKQRRLFAEELARRIDTEFTRGRFGRLTLLVSNPLYGELMRHLGPNALHALRLAVDVDLTAFAVDDVQRRVDEELRALRAPRA